MLKNFYKNIEHKQITATRYTLTSLKLLDTLISVLRNRLLRQGTSIHLHKETDRCLS